MLIGKEVGVEVTILDVIVSLIVEFNDIFPTKLLKRLPYEIYDILLT